MNPFEPLPAATPAATLGGRPRLLAIGSLVLVQTVVSFFSFICVGCAGEAGAAVYWVLPFFVALAWGMLFERRFPGISIREGVAPGVVGGAAVGLLLVTCAGAVLGLAGSFGVTVPEVGMGSYVLIALWLIGVPAFESSLGAIAGIALGRRLLARAGRVVT